MAQQSIISMFQKSNDQLGNPFQDKNRLEQPKSAEMRSESRISVPLQSRKLYYQAKSSCLSCLPCPPVNQVRCLQSCLMCWQTISYLVFAFICVDKCRIRFEIKYPSIHNNAQKSELLLKRIYRTLPIFISFRDKWYYIFTLEIASLMTSSSSAGPIQISKFLESWVPKWNIPCGYSLESPWQGNSHKYSQDMFWRGNIRLKINIGPYNGPQAHLLVISMHFFKILMGHCEKGRGPRILNSNARTDLDCLWQ